MTVCAALKYGNRIYAATDSRINDEDRFRDMGAKFLRLDNDDVLISVCGVVKQEQIIERMLREDNSAHLLTLIDQESVHQLGDAILNRLRQYYKNDDIHDMNETSLLIVSSFCESIFIMDPDFTVSEYRNYAAIGSGSDVCEASLMTAQRFGKTGKSALRTAMEVTCARVNTCGGEIHMKWVTLT